MTFKNLGWRNKGSKSRRFSWSRIDLSRESFFGKGDQRKGKGKTQEEKEKRKNSVK